MKRGRSLQRFDRRGFLCGAAALALTSRIPLAAGQTTRPDVAAIDRDRILRAAAQALARNGIDSLADLTLDLPALAAAHQIDPAGAEHYAAVANRLLTQAFATAATRLDPARRLGTPAALNERATLAETLVALPFVPVPEALAAACRAWCREALDWLTTDRTALLARDAADHTASCWMLLAAACARTLPEEAVLTDLRHRFGHTSLRAQIAASGLFPHELTGPAPLRDSLYNLDLMAGAAQLLSTRFESLWDRELQDGPGMRVAIARFAPYIAAPRTWPYPADPQGFHALPGRRPALLFAARAYNQAEYAALWRTLDPDPALAAAFPIRQPLLWVTQPRRVEPVG